MSDEHHPPKTPEGKLLTDARAAAIRTAVQHLRAIDRMKNGARNPRCSPVVDNGTPQPPGDFLFDLAKLQLQGYEHLLGLADKYADSFVDRLRSMADRGRTAPSAGRPVCIRGLPRSHASDVFHVANHTRVPVVVCFKQSYARPEDGSKPFRMSAKIDALPPAHPKGQGWEIAAFAKQAFRLRVHLVHPFKAGHRYFAEIDVVMRGRLAEQLPVEIEVLHR